MIIDTDSSRNIRDQYERGNLAFKNVEVLLQEKRISHINQFVETEKNLGLVSQLSNELRQLLEAQSNDDRQKIAVSGSKADPVLLADLKQKERESSAARASLDVIQNTVNELNSLVFANQHQTSLLEEKLARIQSLEQLNVKEGEGESIPSVFRN